MAAGTAVPSLFRRVNDDAVTVAASTSSEKVAVTALLTATPLAPARGTVLVTVGAVVSTRQVRTAGSGSVPPSIVQARTENVCEPSARPVSVSGDVQSVKAPPSSSHWKAASGWSDEKVTVADALFDGSAAPLLRNVLGTGGGGMVVKRHTLSAAMRFPTTSATP